MPKVIYKCVDNAVDELMVTEFFGGALGDGECVEDTLFLDMITRNCTAISLDSDSAEKLAQQLLNFAKKARSRK